MSDYFRYPMGTFNYTSGVQNWCEEKSAFWTLSVVGSYISKLKAYSFLIVHFTVSGSKCRFWCQEDSNTKAVIEQAIEFTDLDESAKFYLIDGILLLPEEY